MARARICERVLVPTTTIGPGTYQLGAPVSAGFVTFLGGGAQSGETVAYVAVDSLDAPTQYEIGEGVITAGAPDTLSRVTIRRSSNANAAVSWGAGTKYVFSAPSAFWYNNLSPPLVVFSAAQTITALDRDTVYLFTGGANITQPLPAGAGLAAGWGAIFRNAGTAGAVLTLDPNASEQIDGAATLPLRAGDSAQIVWTGSAFRTAMRGIGHEDGSWTPAVEGHAAAGTPTYTAQVGRYLRIGNLVTAWFDVTLSAKTGILGNIRIAGLPFAASNIAGLTQAGAVGYFTNLDFAAGYTQLSIHAAPNTARVDLFANGDNVGTAPVGANAIAANFAIGGAVTYRIN
jgi:hypothetical protein